MMSKLLDEESRAKGRESAELAKDPKALLQSMGLEQTGKPLEMIKARLKEMPMTCRRTYLTAMKGKSMKAAIKSHCWMCMGWHKSDVAGCTDPACPIYPYRPGA